jgi:hypothetical protein
MPGMPTRIPSREIPIFADEIMVSFTIKREKTGSRKDAMVRMSFIDSMKKSVISEIVVSPITADALSKILVKTLEKLDGAMKGQIKKVDDTTTYIG